MNIESRTAKNINATVSLSRDQAVAQGYVKKQANGYFSTIGNKPVTGDIVAVKQATGEVV
jgi:uncharacterized protein YdbL (DUF1318 family)